ncbi:oligoribonuclease [Vibrio rumoiensis]|uniref:Oligoribonuclease n=1 Tax=Vibrio rumoiensis 1S-45 TaxID=1188252 RepID=A0A1E5DYR9_9VIBR|nr:oligoribonuclease [Vibrio rumoiensis]OEF22752.1 oligoribonuclease [Vibrio rumoiensis 1S-45]
MSLNASFNDQNLIWVDLEMTGLDPETHKIIEIASIVTDSELNILAEGPVLAIHQSEEELAKMDDWCTNTHTHSGLVKRVQDSTISEDEAVAQTIAFLEKWVPKGKSPICGNSIGQDRRFLYKHMPTLEEYFHYRYVDVSTIKELTRRWQPELLNGFSKAGSHLALDDIRESIAELKYYRSSVFKI